MLINKWNLSFSLSLSVSWTTTHIADEVEEGGRHGLHLETHTHIRPSISNSCLKWQKTETGKQKKRRIINAHYRHPQPDHSAFSSPFSLSLCSHSSITFSRLCNHTHTIIIICSRYARRALASCSLFKFFLPFSLLFLSSDHSKKDGREREKGGEEEEKKSVCKLLKSFMNERIEAKKGKTRCSRIHIHNDRFSFFFSLSLILVHCSYLFLLLLFYLPWHSRISVLQNLRSLCVSLSLSLSISLSIPIIAID